MKRKQQPPDPAPALDECPQCTTPTRCGRAGDGKRGPRCVGREAGPDSCDCLNRCGDDPWLKDGRAVACERSQAQAQAAREHAEQLAATSRDAQLWREFSPKWDRSLNRRAEVEQLMLDAARGKRPMPTAEELRAWALRLGTPEEADLRAAVGTPGVEGRKP